MKQSKSPHRKCFLFQTEETCPPMNAQPVKGPPIYLTAGDRPPSTQLLSALVIRILGAQTCPPVNAQRVKGSPIYLIAGDRPPSTQYLSTLVIRILGGQREEPG
ncbi:hypothetical protein CDAR_585081 [Caerostris darwini]|uniref:Uncharacterized protein n=1 Tax=Caerostris darwini TaxID=1538125 RepID=A0AAV4T2Q6_9ARAC|nr:hypothetical protein CDAR_585081 [Caerostris darwini]